MWTTIRMLSGVLVLFIVPGVILGYIILLAVLRKTFLGVAAYCSIVWFLASVAEMVWPLCGTGFIAVFILVKWLQARREDRDRELYVEEQGRKGKSTSADV